MDPPQHLSPLFLSGDVLMSQNEGIHLYQLVFGRPLRKVKGFGYLLELKGDMIIQSLWKGGIYPEGANVLVNFVSHGVD